MLEFKSLETCLTIAQLGSIRAAAAKLNTTQPALSIRVAQLERTLGTKLFDRTGRTMAPTAEGRTLIDYAERILRLRNEMVGAINDRSHIRGSLRLGVSETVVHMWLSPFLRRMSNLHPKLAFEIDVDISVNLQAKLLRREIDLAFMVGPVSDPNIRSRWLCQYPLSFIAHPDLGLQGRELSVEELAVFPIITFARSTQPYASVMNLMSRRGRTPLRIHACNSLLTVVRITKEGMGIAAITPMIVKNELASGELVELSSADKVPPLDYVAAWLVSPDEERMEQVVAIAEQISQEHHI
jgi:DNA-binding transcriptional LysR family regulator